jgi:hypothetical protein
VERARFSPTSLPAALDDYQASDLRRIRLVVSVAVIVALTVKVILLVTVEDFANWWDSNGALHFLKLYIVPHQVPLWQIASALNGLLCISLWLYARHVIRVTAKNRAPHYGTVRNVWRTATTVSVVLSLYSIACTALITWTEGRLLANLHRLWNVIGSQWFPL